MPKCRLLVEDAVNVKFKDVDPFVRKKLADALRFSVPNARHTPQYKLGRWDGTISFCSAAGSTYLNLLDRLLPILYAENYEIELIDTRPYCSFEFPEINENIFADKVWPKGHEREGQPIVIRDYQVEAIQTFLKNLQSIQEIATGSGKTLLTALLSWLVQKYGRSVIIVPSKNLVVQTEKDYRNLGLDVGVFYGDRKEWNHKHTICTWQSMASFSRREKSGEITVSIDDFLKDVICVICDECHSAKGKELKDLLTGPFSNVPIRWGVTGTVPQEEHEFMCLLSSLGPVVGEIKASDLQEKGVLANCQVEVVQMIDDHVGFKNYIQEHEFLLSDLDRLKKIAQMITEWSDNGNTFVLVDRIETGELLQKLVADSVFVYGGTKVKDRLTEYDSIQETNGKVIIATYGISSVGINVPRIFNLVLLEAGHSFVRTIQSIGRGLRKAEDKDFINIYDVCSSLKYSKRHLTKRKQYYNSANYPYNTTKISY